MTGADPASSCMSSLSSDPAFDCRLGCVAHCEFAAGTLEATALLCAQGFGKPSC
jgi:hypothetical protein